MNQRTDRILRDRQVFDVTKLSKTTRWRLEREGLFPKKIQLSKNCVGWWESQILSWLEQRSHKS
jgi:prophage regulatory protein